MDDKSRDMNMAWLESEQRRLLAVVDALHTQVARLTAERDAARAAAAVWKRAAKWSWDAGGCAARHFEAVHFGTPARRRAVLDGTLAEYNAARGLPEPVDLWAQWKAQHPPFGWIPGTGYGENRTTVGHEWWENDRR